MTSLMETHAQNKCVGREHVHEALCARLVPFGRA